MFQVYEFDPAEYLTDEKMIAAYLENAVQTGSLEDIEEARRVAERARARLQAKANGA